MNEHELIFVGILVAISLGLMLYSLFPSKQEEGDRVRRRMKGARSNSGKDNPLIADKPSSGVRGMIDKVVPIVGKPVMPGSEEEMTALKEKLAQAGFRYEGGTRYFLASKMLIGGAAAVIFLAIGMARAMPAQQLFGLATLLGGIGFLLPNLWLLIARKSRAEKIRNGLPDSLDLMVVSVESGLGLDASLQRVSDEMIKVHPELSEEIRIAVIESQMGVPRMEALEKMARRSGVDEVRSLVNVIGQAERFGTSVAKALRTQSDTLRIKRRQAAEERAQKTTVKLMLPLILFIFPSIFVVLIGPAAMKIIETFASGKL